MQTRKLGNSHLEVIPTLEELGIGLVSYSPLGKGFLTGEHWSSLGRTHVRRSARHQ